MPAVDFLYDNHLFQATVSPIHFTTSSPNHVLLLLLLRIPFLYFLLLLLLLQMASPPKMAAKQKKKWANSFSEEELQVAQILFQLQRQRPFHDSRSRPFLFWGRKKKRSSIFYPISSPSPPSNSEKCQVVKVDASSPATPLSFSPSDTDSKSKQFRRRRRRTAFKNKRNEQLTEIFAALTSQQEQLKYEISKVKHCYDKLRAANLLLKARQFELFLIRKNDQLDLNSCTSLNIFGERKEQLSHLFEEKQASHGHQPSLSCLEEKQAPLVHKQSPNATTVVGNFRYHDPHVKMSLLSESGLSLRSNYPYIVLDNNLLLDEAARRDFHCKAALAAQARKRRIEINRAKSSMAAKPPRLR